MTPNGEPTTEAGRAFAEWIRTHGATPRPGITASESILAIEAEARATATPGQNELRARWIDSLDRARLRTEVLAVRQARATATPELDVDAPLSLRRHAAADLCVALSRDLTALGFGCEIIATWDTDAGSERVAAHVTTANPQLAALSGAPSSGGTE